MRTVAAMSAAESRTSVESGRASSLPERRSTNIARKCDKTRFTPARRTVESAARRKFQPLCRNSSRRKGLRRARSDGSVFILNLLISVGQCGKAVLSRKRQSAVPIAADSISDQPVEKKRATVGMGSEKINRRLRTLLKLQKKPRYEGKSRTGAFRREGNGRYFASTPVNRRMAVSFIADRDEILTTSPVCGAWMNFPLPI